MKTYHVNLGKHTIAVLVAEPCSAVKRTIPAAMHAVEQVAAVRGLSLGDRRTVRHE